MISFIEDGDIFTSGCEMITNATNCVGIMGAGLALAFKTRFPKNYHQYVEWCKGRHVAGDIFFYHHQDYHLWIANFATKTHWRDFSDYGPIIDGLFTMKDFIISHNIKSVAYPALGCGFGGLVWDDVKLILEDHAKTLPEDVIVRIYEPRSN